MLSCSIHRCGDVTILWDIPRDDETEFPFPTAESISAISDFVDELTSVVTVNTLGVINRGRAQRCAVQYEREDVTEHVFTYTLESKFCI